MEYYPKKYSKSRKFGFRLLHLTLFKYYLFFLYLISGPAIVGSWTTRDSSYELRRAALKWNEVIYPPKLVHHMHCNQLQTIRHWRLEFSVRTHWVVNNLCWCSRPTVLVKLSDIGRNCIDSKLKLTDSKLVTQRKECLHNKRQHHVEAWSN